MAEKSESEDDSEGLGCFIFLGIVYLAIGAGTIWGDGAGWLAAGIGMLFCVALAVVKR
jgi:hypothetical protein